jgi:hypothetical protein
VVLQGSETLDLSLILRGAAVQRCDKHLSSAPASAAEGGCDAEGTFSGNCLASNERVSKWNKV